MTTQTTVLQTPVDVVIQNARMFNEFRIALSLDRGALQDVVLRKVVRAGNFGKKRWWTLWTRPL